MLFCAYGCGQEGKFKTSNGKDCCSVRYNSCPAVKAKNSKACSNAFDEGRKNCDHLDGHRNWNKGLFTAEFTYDGKGNHKQVLIQERGHKCESCRFETWLEKPITLELEHVDGNTKNNVKENLKLLCPNCHSQTPTWRRRKGSGTGNSRYSEQVMIDAIITSKNMQQALNKLDMKWGSSATLMKVKDKNNLKFKE